MADPLGMTAATTAAGDTIHSTRPDNVDVPAGKAELCLTESADKTYVTGSGQDVTYTLVIKNGGTVPITTLTMTNPLPLGMIYHANSTLLNDTPPYANQNPAFGIPIGTLAAGASYKLQFTFRTA